MHTYCISSIFAYLIPLRRFFIFRCSLPRWQRITAVANVSRTIDLAWGKVSRFAVDSAAGVPTRRFGMGSSSQHFARPPSQLALNMTRSTSTKRLPVTVLSGFLGANRFLYVPFFFVAKSNEAVTLESLSHTDTKATEAQATKFFSLGVLCPLVGQSKGAAR